MFRQPPRVRLAEPTPEGSDLTVSDPLAPTPGSPADPGYPGESHAPTPRTEASTGTSASLTDREARKLTPQLAVALVAAGFAITGWVVSTWKRGQKLREPTKDQAKDIGQPLGRILARHIPVDWLNDDLIDAVEMTAGVGNYLNDGPLLTARRADHGQLATPTEETP
jgi:hypothetical protein